MASYYKTALVLPSHVVSFLKKGLLVWLEMGELKGTCSQITFALGEGCKGVAKIMIPPSYGPYLDEVLWGTFKQA